MSLRRAIALYVCACTILSAQFASAELLATYATGTTPEFPGEEVIFRIEFNPAVKDSGTIEVVVHDSSPFGRFDNIDFVPGSNLQRVAVTTQPGGNGSISHYNVLTGAKLSPIVPFTNVVTVPPASGVSQPASFVPNPAGTHLYYVENQFGFDMGGTDRLMRTPVASGGGPQDVVFDAADPALAGLGFAGRLENFSGTEIVGSTMYFFARDTADPVNTRALMSIGLNGAGVWDGAMIAKEIGGLTEAPGIGPPAPGVSDGSDELDFDPATGLLFGTNIVSGELIAFNPVTGLPVTPPATTAPFFIDPLQVLGGAADGLGLLSRQIDGIRPDGDGNLIIIGHDGVLFSVDVAGVLLDGPDDLDVTRLLDVASLGIQFDDHTLVVPANVPEPATFIVAGFGLLFLFGATWRRRG